MPNVNWNDLTSLIPDVFSMLANPAVVVDGLNQVLKTLQDLLNGEIFGFDLPLIGNLLADNPVSNFIEDFRVDVLQPFANTLRQANFTIEGLLGLIEQTFLDAFGPGPSGLDILKDADANQIIDLEDIGISLFDDSGVAIPFAQLATQLGSLDTIQFDFDVGKTFTFLADPIDIDLKIPAFGLAANLRPRVSIDFNLHIGFGVDDDLGFYFVADYDDPELTTSVQVDFGTTTEALADDADAADIQAELQKLAGASGASVSGSGGSFTVNGLGDLPLLAVSLGGASVSVTDNGGGSFTVNVSGPGEWALAVPAQLQGQLLFLALTLTDGVDLDGYGFDTIYGPIGSGDFPGEDFSKLFLTASLDLQDASNGDGKLTFPELFSQQLIDKTDNGTADGTVLITVDGGALLRTHAMVDFGSLDPDLANVLPSIHAELIADFAIHYVAGDGLVIDPPSVGLANINLNLGDLIDGFVGDVIRGVKSVLDPLEWLIGPDGLLNFRIPLLSDLLGQTVRVRDLINVFDSKNGPAVNKFLDVVEELYFLVGLIDDASAGGNLALSFGDLVLVGGATLTSRYGALFNVSAEDTLTELTGVGGDVRDLKSFSLDNIPEVGDIDFGSKGSQATKSFTSGVTGDSSFQLKLFDPETIFALILGQPDVTLFTFEFPEMGFEFLYRQSIPIIGPLVGTFAGKFYGGLDLGFGYDTRGLSDFLGNYNPASLLNGFFLNDVDPVTGVDRDEAFFGVELAVGAGIDLGIAKAGVEAGFAATILFNFADLDQDTKIRADELAANLLANSYNPISVFDVSGKLEIFLRAYFEALFIKLNFEFARLTLFEFDIPFERPAIMGDVSGGTLTLNIGPSAMNRLNGNTSDGNETIFVKQVGSDVHVWGDQFSRSESNAQVFSDVTKIVADGGAGNDVIDMHLVTSIATEIRGGQGDDTLIGGNGPNVLIGNGGRDKLTGGTDADELFGGEGDDNLLGGAGNDKLFGEAGNDILDGQGDDDILDGGTGDNVYTRSAGLDQYTLLGTGSTQFLAGAGSDHDEINLSELFGSELALPNAFTVFVKDGKMLIGTGEQHITTNEILLNPAYAFTNFNTQGAVPDFFEHQVFINDATDITKLVGGGLGDNFYVVDTAAGTQLTIDGGLGPDRFFLVPGSTTIDAIIQDTGEGLGELNQIVLLSDEFWGASAAPDNVKITEDTIILDNPTGNQTVQYVSPPGVQNTDQLVINVRTLGADDKVTVESTSLTVPVRVETGEGADIVTVGGKTGVGVDGIKAILQPGLNGGSGIGPLVVVGGAGHDTIIVDDSQDNTGDIGNMTAFVENRVANNSEFTESVEVGIVSGLGMRFKVQSGVMGDGVTAIFDGPSEQDGRIEFEGFETADIQLGSGDDVFTVGGGFSFNNAKADAAMALQNAQLPVNRFASTPNGLGVTEFVHTISGSTLIAGNDGEDEFRVLRTQDLAQDQASEVNRGVIDLHTVGDDPNVYHLETLAPKGFFVLEFQSGEDDTVPGAEQSVVLPFEGLTVTALKEALQKLRIVGGDYVTVAANGDGFDITFDPKIILDDIPLRAYETQLYVDGGLKDDTFHVQSIDQPTYLTGGTENDAFNLNVFIGPGGVNLVEPPEPLFVPIPAQATSNGINDLLTADGEVGSDDYLTYLFGSTINSQINLFDSGLPSQGTDSGIIMGTDADDLFLMRAAVADGGLAFVALLKPGELTTLDNGSGSSQEVQRLEISDGGRIVLSIADSKVDPESEKITTGTIFLGDDKTANAAEIEAALDKVGIDVGVAWDATENAYLITFDANGDFAELVVEDGVGHVERVNYTGDLDSIQVFGLTGDDRFGIDDVRVDMTIYGGPGEEFFQVGQLYKTERTPAAGVPNADVFATIETTRGFLSNGISSPVAIYGGDDNDEFVVYHNLAPLALFGGDGDDSFLIRAFALVGSQEDLRERTDVSGGAGADLIQYAVNAPVNIDGGDGFDTVIVIGTEFNDDFVITENGVFGAGLNILFVRIESVEVDGAEGDDRFFIRGTGADLITKTTGGLGSDTFFTNGATPDVVSNDLLGHSGLISNLVYSDGVLDSEYAGQKVEGISSNVADDDEPAIRIIESDGSSVVSQALGDSDSYGIVLTRKPENDAEVIVKAFAPTGLRFKSVNGVAVPVDDSDAVILVFDPTNWNEVQTVEFEAAQRGSIEVFETRKGNAQENELQLISIGASGGTFELTYNGNDTGPIDYVIDGDGVLSAQEINAAAIEAAFSGIGETVKVTGAGTNYSIEFTGDPNTDVGDITVKDNSLTANDFDGVVPGFITHDIQVQDGAVGFGDTITGLFVAADTVEGSREVSIAGGLPTFTIDQGMDSLRGATVKVISGEGIGQVRLIVGNDADTLTVNNAWSRPLDTTSRIEVLRYSGVISPALLVEIVGDDAPAVDLRETEGGTYAMEAPELNFDAPGFLYGDINTDLVDTVQLSLAEVPLNGPVTANLDGAGELRFFTESGGVFTDVTDTGIEFTDNSPETVYIVGIDDQLVEGFHKPRFTVSTSQGGSATVTGVRDGGTAGSAQVEELIQGSLSGNEVQRLSVSAFSGTFKLSLTDPEINDGDAFTTGVINFDSTDLEAVAGQIVTELSAVTPVSVEIVNGKFEITFTNELLEDVTELTVVDSALVNNEIQRLDIDATEGSLRLTLTGYGVSTDITIGTDEDANAEAVQAALEDLVGTGNVEVTASKSGTRYFIEFIAAPATDLPTLTVSDNSLLNNAEAQVVVDVGDNEVPGVLVLQSDGSTNVVEVGDGNFDHDASAHVYTQQDGDVGKNEIQVLSFAADGGGFKLTLADPDNLINGGNPQTTAGTIFYNPGNLETVRSNIETRLEAFNGINDVSVTVVDGEFRIEFLDPDQTNLPKLTVASVGVSPLYLSADPEIPAEVAEDSYRIVLLKAPKAGETVSVDVVAEPTRTQRGGGYFGIRAFTEEVILSEDVIDFGQGGFDWWDPQEITVSAVPDERVDGGDSKSFATQLDLANNIEGPLVVTGGVTEDRSADLEREPVMLLGEENFKKEIGPIADFADLSPALEAEVVESLQIAIDIGENVDGTLELRTETQGGSAGLIKVNTNTQGRLVPSAAGEVQVLTIDAVVAGWYRLRLGDVGATTADILFDPFDTPENNANRVEVALTTAGITGTDVIGDGSTFVIKFALNPLDPDVDELQPLGPTGAMHAPLTRVGVVVEGTADLTDPVVTQELSVYGNGGTFRLDFGGETTDDITLFDPKDTDQAEILRGAIQAIVDAKLGADKVTVTVRGAGSQYEVEFDNPGAETISLLANDGGHQNLIIREVQTLRVDATSGKFVVEGMTGGALDYNASEGAMETALATLGVEAVVKEGAVYTVYFSADADQPELVVTSDSGDPLQQTIQYAIETKLSLAEPLTADPTQLVDFTLEIVRGDAKNKFRLITDVTVDPINDKLYLLDIDRPWEGGLTPIVPSADSSLFTLERTNPNLLVDEDEETDILYFNDDDSVVSYDNGVLGMLEAGALTVSADQLLGLGMAPDPSVVGGRNVPGGVTYGGLEELYIDLGAGDNLVTVEDTHGGTTVINTGLGEDTIDVLAVSGHSFVNAGPDADTVNVTSAGLVEGIANLLTLTGDVPQVSIITLGKGSSPDPAFKVEAVDEIQQFRVDATGGTFQLGFTHPDGLEETQFTVDLAYNASAADVQNALEALAGIDPGEAIVTKFGSTYRVGFKGDLGARDIPLLQSNDFNLTSEGPIDHLTVDDSAELANSLAVLTNTSLTGLGMGENVDGAIANEVQTVRIDATGGTFSLSYTPAGDPTDTTDPMAYDVSAAEMQSKLESLDGIGVGNVRVDRVDDVYVVEFRGLLSNFNAEELVANNIDLVRTTEDPSGLNNNGEDIVVEAQGPADSGLIEVQTRFDGITAVAVNELQVLELTFDALNDQDAVFTLSFGDDGNVTGSDPETDDFVLTFGSTVGELQLALESLDGIASGDVKVREVTPTGPVTRAFEIEFVRELSSQDVPELSPTALTAGTAALNLGASINGLDTAINDVQVLTVDAEGGTFVLTLSVPQVDGTLLTFSTQPIAFDVSGDDMRRELQNAYAFAQTGANEVQTLKVEGVSTDFFRLAFDNPPTSRLITLQDGDGASDPEIQQLTIDAVDGSFTVTDGEAITGQLDFDVSAAALETALESLPTIGAGKVTVTDMGSGVYEIEFDLTLGNVRELFIDDLQLQPGNATIKFDPNASAQLIEAELSRLEGFLARALVEPVEDGVGGVPEVQKLTINSDGGTFTLADATSVTGQLDYDITALDLAAAINGLDSISGAGVSLSGHEYTITFAADGTNYDLLTVNPTLLTGKTDLAEGVYQIKVSEPSDRSYEIEFLNTPFFADVPLIKVVQDSTGGSMFTAVQGVREAFKTDFEVTKINNDYIVNFQGKTRQLDAGPGVGLFSIDNSGLIGGEAQVATRMNGINYYGFEVLDILLGSGADVVNVQGTSAGSYQYDLASISTTTDGGATSEIQELSIKGAGDFTLSLNGMTTTPINVDPGDLDGLAQAIEDALVAAGIDASVSASDERTFEITFDGTDDQPLLAIDDSEMVAIAAWTELSSMAVMETSTDGNGSDVPEVQRLTLNAVGDFSLSLGVDTTGAVTVDPADLDAVSAAIEAALAGIGETVTVERNDDRFTITFDGFADRDDLVVNNISLRPIHAVTNISLGANQSNGQVQSEQPPEYVFVSSDANLDRNTVFSTDGATDQFDFLTGNLDDVDGDLNIAFGDGRHGLMVSDEVSSEGDQGVVISDLLPDIPDRNRLATVTDIWMTGLAFGGISYGTGDTANLYEGVVYWTGSGNDEIRIDGSHVRDPANFRTTTI